MAGPRRRPLRYSTLLTLVLALGVAGCSDPRGLEADAAPRTAGGGSVDIVAEAKANVERAFTGTFRPPDPSPRPAVRDKFVIALSAGQSSPTSSIPVGGANDAATAMGWKFKIYDSGFDIPGRPALVRQAMTERPDALVVNFDCSFAAKDLTEAKAAGILIVPLIATDCDESTYGPGGKSVFAGRLGGLAPSPTPGPPPPPNSISADSIIAATNGTAKVITFVETNSTSVKVATKNFIDRMAQCGGCQVLEVVEFQSAEFDQNRFQQKVTAALLRHPDANAIRSPFSAATQRGIARAVDLSGRDIFVTGGEGQLADLDLIRTDRGLDSCTVGDLNWLGWATMDLLNSLFIGQPPKPSGLGTMMIDRKHNLPATGPFVQRIDFRSAYRRAWGVG